MGAAILTDLSLRLRTDSVELSKGLERAKKNIGQFKKDTKQATGEIKSVFSQIGGDAAAGFSRMGGGFSAMTGAMRGSLGAVKSLIGGMNGLKAALISTGIGAIFVAIGVAIAGVMAYFKGTVEGARDLAGITGFLKGVFTSLKDVFIDVGRFLVKMFKDPKEGIAELWEFIKQNLVNRFEGLVEIFRSGWSAIKNGALGVGYAIAGIFSEEKRAKAKEYFDAMAQDVLKVGQAALQVATGLDMEKTLEKGRQIMEDAVETGKKSALIEKQKHDLYIKNTKFLTKEANLMNQIAELTEISANKDLDASVSMEATNKAIQVSRDLYAQKVALADEEIRIKKQEMALGENSKEDERALAELEKNRIMLLKERTDKERELMMRGLEIKARMNAAQLKAETERKAKEDAIKKAEEDEEKKRIDSIESYRKQVLGQTLEGQLTLLKEIKDAKMIGEREYFSEYNRIQDEIEKRDQEAKDKAIQDAKQVTQTKIDLANQYLDQVAAGIDAYSTFYEAAKNKELAAAGNNEEQKAAIERKYARKQKQLSIAQAIINTAQGITKAFAQGGILGLITGAIVSAAGISQIALIKSQPLAKGGIAYKPTNALIGEYPGARSNPEVVAPLNKLKSLLGNSGVGTVKFRIDGRELVGILQKQNSLNNAF